MKWAERIFAIATLVGALLMFQIVSEGRILFLISLLCLSGIYFALGFLLFNKMRLRNLMKKEPFVNLTTIRIVFGAITGVALSIICVGALFKFLNLPGSGEMLMLGVTVVFLISIAAIIMRSKIYAASILIRTSIIGTIGLILVFTTSLSIIKFQYRNHPTYVEAYKQYLENPSDRTLWEKHMLEYNRIWMSPEEFEKYEQELNEL